MAPRGRGVSLAGNRDDRDILAGAQRGISVLGRSALSVFRMVRSERPRPAGIAAARSGGPGRNLESRVQTHRAVLSAGIHVLLDRACPVGPESATVPCDKSDSTRRK